MSNRYTRQEWLQGRRFRSTRPRGGYPAPELVVVEYSDVVSVSCRDGRHGDCLRADGACMCPCHVSPKGGAA